MILVLNRERTQFAFEINDTRKEFKLVKNTLITSGVYQMFLDTKKELYLAKEDCSDLNMYLRVIPDMNQLEECMRIYKANRQRKYNNWNEICKWLFMKMNIEPYKKYKMIFGTLTFSDKVLETTSEETRRRYTTRYLSEKAFHYIANVDFGTKNDREHYHFLALVEERLNHQDWQYGLSHFQEIKFSPKDIKRAKNYILKLNNHSYKTSTKLKRIIRDRKEDFMMEYFTEKIGSEKFHRFKLILNEN